LSEADITRKIQKYLKDKGVFHFKQWQGPLSVAGLPDILGILPGGRFFGIEVKAGRNTTTRMQERFIDKINTAGGLAFVARSVDDVMEHIR